MNTQTNNYRTLTPEEERVIVKKGTEYPYTGEYNDHYQKGVYKCKRCDAPLYKSDDKFTSGWSVSLACGNAFLKFAVQSERGIS